MSMCVLSTLVSCAKTAELIEMPFGGLTYVDPRNHVLDRVNIRWIHSPPQGVTRRRCSLLPNYFGHLFSGICQQSWNV